MRWSRDMLRGEMVVVWWTKGGRASSTNEITAVPVRTTVFYTSSHFSLTYSGKSYFAL